MREEIIEHDELTLGVLAAGSPADAGLVLVHGWPQSKEVYDQVVDELASNHFVLAFDLPAIGDSLGAPQSAEKMALADILLGAAERAGAHSIVVAGFDVGGMIAYAAARDFGNRIRGAVVMNTVIPGIDPWSKILGDPRIWHFAFHATPELPELLVAGHQRAYFDFFVDFLAGDKDAVSERLGLRSRGRTSAPRHSRRGSIGTEHWRPMPSATASPRRSIRPCSTCAAMPTVATRTTTCQAYGAPARGASLARCCTAAVSSRR